MTIILIQLFYNQNNTEFLPHVDRGGAVQLKKIQKNNSNWTSSQSFEPVAQRAVMNKDKTAKQSSKESVTDVSPMFYNCCSLSKL